MPPLEDRGSPLSCEERICSSLILVGSTVKKLIPLVMASSNRECASEDAHIFSVNMERADVSSSPVVVGGGGGDSIIRAIPNSFTMSTPFPSESSRATGQSSNPARSRPLPKVVRAARAAGGIVRIPLIVGRGVKRFLVEALVEGPLWARALNLVLMIVIVVLVFVLFGTSQSHSQWQASTRQLCNISCLTVGTSPWHPTRMPPPTRREGWQDT